MRGALIGVSAMPLLLDFVALLVSSVIMVSIGTYLFSKTEVD